LIVKYQKLITLAYNTNLVTYLLGIQLM